jgi:hypothetical protein
MSEIELFPSDDDSFVAQAPSQLPTAATSSHAQQDTASELPTSPRGRRSSRAASRTPRRRGLPSPPPSRPPPPSPASSYTSAQPNIPAIEKWTVLGLRQALISADVHFSRRMNKAQLYNLYVSLQAAFPSPKSTPPSKSAKKASNYKAPNSRSQKSPSPALAGPSFPRAPGRSRPPASLGRAPDSAAVRPLSSLRSAELQTAVFSSTAPHVTMPVSSETGRSFSVSMPTAQAQLPHTFPVTFSNPFPCPWPAAPPPDSSARLLQLEAQAQAPFLPPQLPSFSTFPVLPQALGADPSVRLPPQTASAPGGFLPDTFPQNRSPFTLFSATPMPIPPNATAMEPPPVASNIRAQILTGADIDLSSLLSLLPPSVSNRQIDCGDFAVTLKNPVNNSSRILSFSEFAIAFSRYSEIICAALPHRRRELNDYLAIIAELALSYGGTHFYTYHKLFSAKCAVRVAQWNQCPYWGALDTELHNRVFLGCRNISCAVCRSVSHSTTACPLINPANPPRPDSPAGKSTSYVPRPANINFNDSATDSKRRKTSFPSNNQVCNNFNSGRCSRQRCRYLHICSYCGGAHARTICPVKRSVNKDSKNYLSTPVNFSRLSSELAHHPNTNFTDYLLSGLEHGFKPGVESLPTQSIICDNLQSALAEPETVDILIKKEIESGFMIGPFNIPPFECFRISPIGVATRKFSGKKRLIIDLSAPHNSPFPSINSLISLEQFSLHYHTIDQAITLIKDAGYGAWLAKVDITSAFKVMPIHPDSWHLFGVRWQEKFYFAVRLTFGCKSSPKIFDMLSEAICWILSNNYSIPYLIHLLDDFLIISPPDAIPAAHLLTVQKVFAELGIPIAQEKTMGPATSIEFLGINLDTVNFQASLPKEKIDRIILVASTLLENPNCSKRELLSLLGHLNFAMRIIPQGRPFISHLLFLASSIHALEDQISLTTSCCNELSLWITFLKQWNGLSFFYNNLISLPVDIQLFTDAAPSVGFGGFYQGRWFASTWPAQLLDSPQSQSSSALFELYPLVVAAFLWGKEWSTNSIMVHCDNEATVHCINKGRSNSPALMPLLRRLIWIAACDQFILTAKHVPGSRNQIADSLSRFAFQKFRLLAPDADPFPTPVPHYSELIFP